MEKTIYKGKYDFSSPEPRRVKETLSKLGAEKVLQCNPPSGAIKDSYHLEPQGVTIKYDYSSFGSALTLFGSEEKIGEVEKIILKKLSE